MHGWNESIHGVPDFEYVHERASFDYLRDKICVRSGEPFKGGPEPANVPEVEEELPGQPGGRNQ
jgi:hypothetical protein